ncbi:hypothetical protein [Mycolicibacterium chubuense]|uniref:Uncharacterized protein n=1 Tax=Mycolicibacterium chubuense TaxID=1800 RepID=A0A0J6VKJ3_MYCCU|nr:hypothetical protein [Mycolicibacterium chubuense]KMO71515.1 hypothetical protein MCHUDSM44219_05218 [Mycolicibacterium chubuense]SPX99657.1 Uncharacterised protein [Mycolicibacterium chubuense]
MTPSRLRLRRRLLVLSTPPAVVALVVAVKMISVVVAGHNAQQHYDDRAIADLRDDVSILRTLDVIQPATTDFAAGALAVLEDRLDTADAEFTQSLAGTATDRSCPVRVNLELVRERQGDIAAWEARLDDARDRYGSALTVIDDAPPACFSGNDDPDPDRRAVRADAAARIAAKLRTLGTVAPVAPPPPPPPANATPSAPIVAAPESEPPQTRRLEPAQGDPLEALRRLLRDAATG